MKKKVIAVLMSVMLLILAVPYVALADDSTGTSSATDNQSVSDSVYDSQNSTGSTGDSTQLDEQGTTNEQQTDQNTVPQQVQDEIAKLKQELETALSKNQMARAMQILIRLRKLQNSGETNAEVETLKQQVLSDVQNDNYDDAIKVMKKILSTEHKGYNYKYMAQLYHMANKDKQVHIFTNGQELQSDVEPIIENGRTLVPLRAVANALGIGNNAISWNDQDETVTINYNNNVINLPVNSPTVTVNGRAQNIDVPAQMHNNRVMVPLRFISNVLKKPVNWYPEGQLVSVGN